MEFGTDVFLTTLEVTYFLQLWRTRVSAESGAVELHTLHWLQLGTKNEIKNRQTLTGFELETQGNPVMSALYHYTIICFTWSTWKDNWNSTQFWMKNNILN